MRKISKAEIFDFAYEVQHSAAAGEERVQYGASLAALAAGTDDVAYEIRDVTNAQPS